MPELSDDEKKFIIARDLNTVSPKKLVEKMNKHVVGQEQAKRILAVALYNHCKRIANMLYPERQHIDKSNVLLLGPTGSGKTYLIESICKEMEIPFGIADAASLTASGYWGEDVENIILPLLENCNRDAGLAARGIVYVDEIDKIAACKDGNGRDVNGKGVQRSLLKIIEGKACPVMPDKNKWTQTINVDTTNILFIFGGAFSGIEEVISKRTGARDIGFSANNHDQTKLVDSLTAEDIISYGFMPELMGRIPNIARLNKLTVRDLRDILTIPENSIVNQYKSLFWHDGIVLEFTQDALDFIAERALEQKIGARGLRAIMEHALLDIMYEAPSQSRALCIVTKDRIKDRF